MGSKRWKAIRKCDKAFAKERDRRYAEVNVEKEKALKIKEAADLAALQLAREIQTYKDEKANELREQINAERGLYATKDDLAALTRESRVAQDNLAAEFQASLKPLNDFVAGGYAVKDTRRFDVTTLLQMIGVLVAVGVALTAILIH